MPERTRGDGLLVVQAKDILGDGTIDKSGVVCVNVVDTPGSAHQLQPGDVLIQPRGRTYKAGAVGPDLAHAIAAAPLYTLRPQSPLLDPQWLALFLSAPATQAALAARARGTFIPQVPRDAIEELEIDVPDLESQRRLATLTRLVRREHAIAQQIFEHRITLIGALTRRLSNSQRRSRAPGKSPV